MSSSIVDYSPATATDDGVEMQPPTTMTDDGVEMQPPTTMTDDGVEMHPVEMATGCSKLCGWYQFEGVTSAKGFITVGMGKESLIISNIFLSTSLIHLASEQAGCVDADGLLMKGCQTRVYGMLPVALITNIAVVSGLLSAFLMPLVGAAVDYTPHRRKIGMYTAALIMLIQAVQIGTLPNTWFAMSVLQGIAGFLYQIQVLTSFAYLPAIARIVGEAKMANFNATFVFAQNSSMIIFLIVVTGLSIAISLDDVQTGQLSQGVNTLWSGLLFYVGWRTLPSAPAAHELPENKTLFTQSFAQVWQTIKSLNKNYDKSLRWFFLALIFAEAAANAFVVVAVVFLGNQLGMTGAQIGIFFLVALLGALPGSKIGAIITSRNNPNISWRLSMVFIIATATTGAVVLDKGLNVVAYVWGFFIGLGLGWFNSCQKQFLSMLLPKGQEAELSGFFVYCTQILGWLPPLIFSLMVENNIHQRYGIVAILFFFVIAIAILSMLNWTEAVEQIHGSKDQDVEDAEDEENAPV